MGDPEVGSCGLKYVPYLVFADRTEELRHVEEEGSGRPADQTSVPSMF